MNSLFLNVSELHITDQDKIIKTILGSCVAIIMHVPRLKLSAICHSRLPSRKSTLKLQNENRFCYVDENIHFMIKELLKAGANKSEIIVKAFGGAKVISGPKIKNISSIGEQNIGMVKRTLALKGLELASYEFGGESGRKLVYHTRTNKVLVKSITKDMDEEVNIENEIALLLKDFVFNR